MTSKNNTVQLLEEIKKHRNDMVARNYPFQQLTNLIYKWEDILREESKVSATDESNISASYDIGTVAVTENFYDSSPSDVEPNNGEPKTRLEQMASLKYDPICD
jgi:hypothetical protein